MKKIIIVVFVCLFTIMTFVSCARESVGKLDNTFTGAFFTVNCTYDFIVNETGAGAVLTDGKSGLQIEIAGLPMPESKSGEIGTLDMMTGNLSKEKNDLSVSTIKIDKHKALWLEGNHEGVDGITAMIPLNGWVIVSNIKEAGNTEESLELGKKIIKSLKITDDGYLKESADVKETYKPEPWEKDATFNTEKTEDTQNDKKEAVVARILGEKYQGNYFSILHPKSTRTMDNNMGDEDMVMLMIDNLNVTIIATREHELITSEEEITKSIKISGFDAMMSEMKVGNAMIASCSIDMGQWWILIMGTSEGERTGADYQTFLAMLDTFIIEKPDYLNK